MYFGKNVKLRAHKREDMKRIYEFLNDYELKSIYDTVVAFPSTIEQIEKDYNEETIEDNGKYSFAIEHIETGRYIGSCIITETNFIARVAKVGIIIGDKEFIGKGFGTDAMKVFIKFIFYEMNMNKVKLEVFSHNKRAIKSYEKCGFKVEGVLREEGYKNGSYRDLVLMSILRREYDLNKLNEP